MALTVKMPQLGESVTEGTIGSWLVKPGQQVSQYDSLVEVITDKVTAEVPSPASGTVGELLAGEGQRLAVGEPICTLEGAEVDGAGAESGTEPRATEASATEPPAGEPEVAVVATPAEAQVSAALSDSGPAADAPAPAGRRPAAPTSQAGFVSPAVRALAGEHGIDLARVRGTGFQGRITKRDVMLFLERGEGGSAEAAKPALSGPVPPAPVAQAGERIPLSPMRRSIAEHMVRSRHTSPHAWTMVEVDMAGVAEARRRRGEEFKRATGVELSFLHFGMRATCLALRSVPSMNATFQDDAVELKADLNLGLAVAVDQGLIVPVVRSADRYSLAGLAQSSAELIGRARAGKLGLDDVAGGTFTLNNAGALGTVMSQAIINQPQAGILVMDAVIRRPVVVGDGIAIRPMMNLCLSFDHRINDGAAAARFLNSAKAWLEAVDPEVGLF